MVTTCAVTPNASRVRGATILFALLSGFGAAWCVANETNSRAERLWLALGSILCGYGLAALLRRGQTVAIDRVTPFPRSKGGDGLTRFPCPGMVLGGALLAALPRALGLLRFGVSGLGLGLSTAFVPALAGVLGAGGAAWLVRRGASAVDASSLAAIASILLVIASGLALPGFRAAFASYVPPYRVRFEIGGLGTRIEDLTPVEEREIRPEPAVGWILLGLGCSWLGGASFAPLLLAVLLAPGVAVASTLLSAPLVAIASYVAFSALGILGAGGALLLAVLAACEAQRVASFDRTSAPRSSQLRGLIVACGVAGVLALTGVLRSSGADVTAEGSATSLGAFADELVRGLRWETVLALGAVLAVALLRRKRSPFPATASSLLACVAVGFALPEFLALLFAAGALLALLLRRLVPAWRTQTGALDLGDLALGLGFVELGFWLAALS